MNVRRHIADHAPIVAGVLLGLAMLAPTASAAKLSDEAKSCGAERNTVQAELDIPAASDIWKIVPALGMSPELESDHRPAHVVVFAGDYDPSGLQFAREIVPDRLQRVLCVVQSDGTVNLYTDVLRNGSSFTD